MYNDLSDEIQEHLAEKIEELVSGGMSRKEAAQAARREFGNVTLIEQDSRKVWQWPSIEDFLMDLRYGLRGLRKSPGFTAVAVLTLDWELARILPFSHFRASRSCDRWQCLMRSASRW